MRLSIKSVVVRVSSAVLSTHIGPTHSLPVLRHVWLRHGRTFGGFRVQTSRNKSVPVAEAYKMQKYVQINGTLSPKSQIPNLFAFVASTLGSEAMRDSVSA